MESTKPVIVVEVDHGTGVAAENNPQSPKSVVNNEGLGIEKDKPVIIVVPGVKNPGLGITVLQSSSDSTDEDKEPFEILENDKSMNSIPQPSSAPVQEKAMSSADQDLWIFSQTADKVAMELEELLGENAERQEALKQRELAIEKRCKELSAMRRHLENRKEKICLPQTEKSGETENSINQSKKEYAESKMEESVGMEAASGEAVSKPVQNSQMWKNIIIEQEKEIESLRETDNWLKRQLEIMYTMSDMKNMLILPGGNSNDFARSDEGIELMRSVEQYKSLLKMLKERYAKQCFHYVNVRESLGKAIDIIQNSERMGSKETALLGEQGKHYKLSDLRTKLQNELQEIIDVMPELITAQNQFDDVFGDYNNVLLMLEYAREQNSKMLKIVQPLLQAKQKKRNLGQRPQQQLDEQTNRHEESQNLQYRQPQKDQYVTFKLIREQKLQPRMQHPEEDQDQDDQLWLKKFQERREKHKQSLVEMQMSHLKHKQQLTQQMEQEQMKLEQDFQQGFDTARIKRWTELEQKLCNRRGGPEGRSLQLQPRNWYDRREELASAKPAPMPQQMKQPQMYMQPQQSSLDS